MNTTMEKAAAGKAQTAPQEAILDPSALSEDRRRHEWVTLPGLGRVCVREMLMSESMQVAEYATRPAEDPRGGVDRAEAGIWEIALSCYDGESEQAKRVFDDHQVHLVRRLKLKEFQTLMAAIQRVNGETATEEELLADFTQPTAAGPH